MIFKGSTCTFRDRACPHGRRPTTAAVVTTVLGLGAASPAQAADTTTCAASAPVLAVDAARSAPPVPVPQRRASSTAKFGSPSVIGTGWQTFGKIIAGGSGWLYGLKSDGLYVYHRTAAGRVGRAEPASSASSASMPQPPAPHRIVADQRGTIFALTDAGAVQAYRFDAAHEGLVAVRDLVLQADSAGVR